MTELTFVECTTRAQNKKHWSLPPVAQFGLRPLCGGARAHDQYWVDMNMPAGWRKRRVIADMPLCKQCEKSRQRRIDGRAS